MNLEVLAVEWVHGNQQAIGIVKARDTITDEIKTYMGVGQGFDEDDDIQLIMAYGAKIDYERLVDFLTSGRE